MPLVRRIRKRGANIVVEAYGEILFEATGPVGRWTNMFSQRVGAFARAAAPSNKRPRWAHYGAPLASTITASTTYQPGNMRVYSAIGSGAPHAWYVDQGTGVYNGSGPYPAKVLPPWRRGGSSLYEHTWRPGGPGSARVRPVMIKGQRGQKFFEKGLELGFRSMRMRAFQVGGDPKITNALNALPTGMADFKGNTPNSGAFKASLAEWRKWRDEAWQSGQIGDSPYAPATRGAKKPKKVRAPKPPKAVKPKKMTPDQKRDIARAIGAQLTARGDQFRGLTVLANGTWTALVKRRGQTIFKQVTGRWRSP